MSADVPKVYPLVGLVVAALGCSPASIAPPSNDAGRDSALDAPSDAPADALSSFEGACKNYAYARCTQLQSCSSTAILVQFGDVTTCEQYYAASCEIAGTAPSSGSTIARVNACAGEVPGWKCSDLIYGENDPPDCVAAAGSLPNGSPCGVSAQCQSSWCGHSVGSACGTCAPTPQPGAPCTFGFQCPAGLSCYSGECAAHVLLGGQCSATQPCDDGLVCVSGVCTAEASSLGAACNPLGAGCDLYAGLACNATSNTCQTIQLVPGGEACGIVGAQAQDCVTGSCVRGACVPEAALGAACDITNVQPCISFGECIVTTDGGTMGTCRIPGSTSCP